MDEQRIRQEFWPKIRRVAAHLPFAENAVAAFYCATDPETPARTKAILLAALAYFILPTDTIPDFLPLFGFTDDAAVLAAALSAISAHMKERHHEAARAWLAKLAA